MIEPAAQTPASGAPLTLGRYELLFRFAAGGMAEVYAARSRGAEGFERLVAVKRMLPTMSDDPKFVEMFLDEAKVAANVHSRHVVSTLDLGRASDGSLYIVMDLIRGLSLNRLIKRALRAKEPLPIDVVSEILTQTALGLHDAHEAATPDGTKLEIVHRDVSPQNVLLDRTGAVRLTDFGVARAVERHSRTETGELRGKVAYFAPEQMSGGTIDRRTDVFALGVVAHEMITGKRLFRAENAWLTLQQVASAEIPRVDTLREDVPGALADAIELALDRNPDGRFVTAAAFGNAVREAVAPAGANAVGELVGRLGGEYIDALEQNLRKAAAKPTAKVASVPPEANDAPEADDPAPEEVSGPPPISTTAEVPDVVAAAAQPVLEAVPRPTRRRPPLAVIFLVPCVVAAAAAFGLLWLGKGGEQPLEDPPAADRMTGAEPPQSEAPREPEVEAPPVEPEPVAPPVEPAMTEQEPEAGDEAEPVRRPTGRRARPRPTPAEVVEAADETPEEPANGGSPVLMGSDLFEQELGER
ncbi:MAG: serine/threonine-protein kinase [Sandaracinaceae bacterium]